MYNTNFTDPTVTLLTVRLARLVQAVQNLDYPTKEEYQAQVYSLVNAIVNNGYNAAVVPYIASDTPATIGDFTNPLQVLDNDSSDIISELLNVENSMSTYYNLAAAAANTLRQDIRLVLNASTQKQFIENFISTSQLGSYDGTVDLNAGVYSPNVTSTVTLSPTISLGLSSVGSGDPTELNQASPTTYFSWSGSTVELVLSFPQATAINRLVLTQYDYKDLSITSLTSTPDGSVVQDILEELGVGYIDCGSTANKSLGDTTIDFNPKSCLALRITIADNSNSGAINLESVLLQQLQFSSSTVLVSEEIQAPIGNVVFNAQSVYQEPYSVLSHYLSYDGTSYQAIVPGQIISMPGGTTKYWYKCVLSRNETLITQSGVFSGNGIDPSSSTYYTLQSSVTNSLGNNIIEKNLLFSNINGPVTIDDPIIPNTFYIQQGSTIFPSSNYTLNNGALNLNGSYNNVTVVYQTTADVSSVAGLLPYFGARLLSYSFEVIV